MLGLTFVLLCAAPDPTAQARAAVQAEFDRVGRSTPQADAALDAAAFELAKKALATSVDEAADLLSLTAAMSKAGGFDATPQVYFTSGSPPEVPLKSLKARRDLANEPASHIGVGTAQNGERLSICVLLADRRAEVEKFARQLPSHPPAQKLCATLRDEYQSADLYVTRPDGVVGKQPARHAGAPGRICSDVEFGGDGRYTLELLARGPQGPQVASLFFVQVGKPGKADAATTFDEPKTVAVARLRLGDAVNNLRKGSGLGALQAEPVLDSIAQAYADRMAKENFFAHVSPDGEDLKTRLSRGGYHVLRAGENLGLGPGPLAAHFSIEHSPGHRMNLLEPGYTKMGFGVAKNASNQTIVVEALATPAEEGSAADPYDAAYQALDRWRTNHRLPSLQRSPVLEKLATVHARRALELDRPSAKLPGEDLHERVFAARDDIDTAAVDVYVLDTPTALADSKNLAQAANELVGIGLASGDSPTYGPNRFFVVVVYAHVKH